MIGDLSVLAVIPARGGSKGIPRKNIKILGGKPLIAHTIAAAAKSIYIDKVHISTDDEEIAQVAKEWGGSVPFLRDAKYAADEVPNIPDVIVHIVNSIEREQKEKFDIILLLEPTYPFRNNLTIDKTIETIYNNNETDWVTTVSRSREYPHRMRLYNEKTGDIHPLVQDKNTFSQRQALETLYVLRGAVYAAHRKNINKKLSTCSWKGVVVSDLEGVDIDEPFDFKLAAALMEAED